MPIRTGLCVAVILLFGLSLTSCRPAQQANNQSDGPVAGVGSLNAGESPESASSGTEQAQPTSFADVLALWESSSQEDAINMLATIDWNSEATFAGMPALQTSEVEFTLFSRGKKTELQEAAIAAVSDIRAVARHLLSAAEDAQADGDSESARKLYQTLAAMAGELASSDHLMVIQQVGTAYEREAKQMLDGMK